jgi:threonylcarbamoyladenosine tRNA methylthiotransferase MtaB
MGRPYRLREYEERALIALSAMPGLAIGTDIIAGFPTETEKDFAETLSFLKSFPFAYAHIFSYSKRPGTMSFPLGEMASRVVKERVRLLLAADRANRLKFAKGFIGKELVVVGERRHEGVSLALSGNYLRLRVKGLEPGSLARVKVIGLGEGELLEPLVQNEEKETCQR